MIRNSKQDEMPGLTAKLAGAVGRPHTVRGLLALNLQWEYAPWDNRLPNGATLDIEIKHENPKLEILLDNMARRLFSLVITYPKHAVKFKGRLIEHSYELATGFIRLHFVSDGEVLICN